MGHNYKYVLTFNGNKYVGYYLDNGNFMTTFNWILNKDSIERELTWEEYEGKM